MVKKIPWVFWRWQPVDGFIFGNGVVFFLGGKPLLKVIGGCLLMFQPSKNTVIAAIRIHVEVWVVCEGKDSNRNKGVESLKQKSFGS